MQAVIKMGLKTMQQSGVFLTCLSDGNLKSEGEKTSVMAVYLLKTLCTSAVSPGALAETSGELQEADYCVLDRVRQHLTMEDLEEAC